MSRSRLASLGPTVFKLYRNSPNSFRGATRIAYDLPAKNKVHLSTYDVDGRQVRKLADGRQNAGRCSLNWDGRDKKGRACPAAVYFRSLKTEDNAAVKKMLIAERWRRITGKAEGCTNSPRQGGH